MAYYFGQNTNSLIDQAAANVFKQGTPLTEGGGKICRSPRDCGEGEICRQGKCVVAQCQDDTQCPAGQTCVGGKCIPNQAGCASDADCSKFGADYICYNGKCLQKPATCTGDADCSSLGPNFYCIGGKCIFRKMGPKRLCKEDSDCPRPMTCVNGYCEEPAKAYCTKDADCPSGQQCVEGKCVNIGCATDADCPEGQTCVDGSCKGGGTAECPDGIGTAHEGCACGKKYMLKSGTCAAGYVPVPKPEGTQCECSKWCVDIGWGEDCQTQTTKTGMGAYAYPAGLQELMDLLLGRGKQIMGMTPGFTPEALQGYFGRDFEKLREGEAATKRGLTSGLSRQGMLGTGTATQALGDLGWQTERGVSDIMRDVSLANEAQKREDLSRYTGLGSDIAGQQAQFQSILEAINAARRGEGTAAIQQLLSLLSLLKG